MLSIVYIDPNEWDDPFEQSFITPVEVVVAEKDHTAQEIMLMLSECDEGIVFLDLSKWVCPKPKRIAPMRGDPIDTTALDWVAQKNALGKHCAMLDITVIALVSELTGEQMTLVAEWVVDFASSEPRLMRTKKRRYLWAPIKGVRSEFTGDLSQPEHMFIMH